MNEKFPATKFAPLEFRGISPDEQKQNAEQFYELLNWRRSSAGNLEKREN